MDHLLTSSLVSSSLDLEVGNRVNINMLIDSGADGNFITEDLCEKYSIEKEDIKPVHTVTVKGAVRIHFCTKPVSIELNEKLVICEKFYVIPITTSLMILGKPFLSKHNPLIDWRSGMIKFNKKGKWITVCTIINTETRNNDSQMLSHREFCETADEDSVELLVVSADITGDTVLPEFISDFKDLFIEPDARTNQVNVTDGTDTEGQDPIARKPYRMSVKEQAELKKILNEYLVKGFIVPSRSPWSSPIVFARKKDETL